MTGNAAAHAAADSISNLTITFLDAAFTHGSANLITNYSKNNLVVTFYDPTVLTWSATTFTETMPANDGSITTTVTLTLNSGESFVVPGGAMTLNTHYSVANVPAGLTVAVTGTSATTATVTMTGNAAAHAAADSISNLTITFLNAAFTGGSAASVANYSKNNLVVTFYNPVLTWSATTFTEAAANDGSIDTTVTLTLTGGETFVVPGGVMTATTHYTVANVPAGLTVVITGTSATTATVTMTGNAAAHAAADSITNMGITFLDAAFTGGSAATVTNSSQAALNVTFNNPAPEGGGGGGGGGGLPAGTTDVRGQVTSEGRFVSPVNVTSTDELCILTIPKDTVGLDKNLLPLSQITLVPMTTPPAPPAESTVIGLTYNFGPEGATFDPPVTITFFYDPTKIPAGVNEQNLVLAFCDTTTGQWITLSDIVVNPVTHTISGKTSHFTAFSVIVYTRAAFTTSALTISPAEVKVGESVSISVNIANTSDFAGSYDATLKINNIVVETKKVTLAGHASQNVLFTTSRDAAGSYAVRIDTLSGTFTVKSVPTPAPTPAPPTPAPTTPVPTTPAPPTPAPTTPVPTTPAPTTPAPTSTPALTPAPTNWGLIGGLIAAAIVIIGLFVYFLWWRRRRLA